MNNNEFIEKVKASGACPEGFEDIYNKFCEYQKLALDTLREFHRVCEKNHINYQLAYGSLLGAIRDNGQIPWDYDVDVFVPITEKDNLVKALNEDLNDDYYFYCPENNSKCRHTIMRVVPKGYRSEALHVDVFYLVGIPEDEVGQKRMIAEFKSLASTWFSKLVNAREESCGELKPYLSLMSRKMKCIGSKLGDVKNRYYALANQYPLNLAKYCCEPADTGFVYETDKILKITLYDTAEGSFRIPQNYTELLETAYGDYKNHPPLESCVKEVMQYYNRFMYFEKHYK